MFAVTFGKKPYTLDAAIEAGIAPAVARTLLVDPKRAPAERPFASLTGRRREKEPTTFYIWGPDANAILANGRQS